MNKESNLLEYELLPGFGSPLPKKDGIYFDSLVKDLAYVKNFQLKPDDCFVIGYQKSGNFKIKKLRNFFKPNSTFLRNHLGGCHMLATKP